MRRYFKGGGASHPGPPIGALPGLTGGLSLTALNPSPNFMHPDHNYRSFAPDSDGLRTRQHSIIHFHLCLLRKKKSSKTYIRTHQTSEKRFTWISNKLENAALG